MFEFYNIQKYNLPEADDSVKFVSTLQLKVCPILEEKTFTFLMFGYDKRSFGSFCRYFRLI